MVLLILILNLSQSICPIHSQVPLLSRATFLERQYVLQHKEMVEVLLIVVCRIGAELASAQ